MTSIALARRYRPRTFGAMVGQSVTLQALSNALDNQRLHHAYLFTGMWGVGKTTLARLFAKSLNCEKGISSTPCDICSSCRDMDAGRFVDLLEIDAASRTKVEDTRELLDNVQYLPTRGRFKIYLIDEVHMLSGHSFNALLKTLEEPPTHVKFLLATTDPQKLPATVLSRCLQFHLKRLSFTQIVNYLEFVVKQEGASYEIEALQELSRVAEGSLRDALSLLDQALAYGNGRVETRAVQAMLGLSDSEHLLALLRAVACADAKRVLDLVQSLEESTPDFSLLLTQFIGLIHQIAIAQTVPEVLEESLKAREAIVQLSGEIAKEEIQLYYQIALQGQKDLPYTPTSKMGFEMTLLRMVAFQPVRIAPIIVKTSVGSVPEQPPVRPSAPAPVPNSTPTAPEWETLINQLNITGLVKALAEQCVITLWSETVIGLALDEIHKPMWNKRHEERLCEALSHYLGHPVRLQMTFRKIEKSQKREQPVTNRPVNADPKIQTLLETFDAKIVE